MEETAKKPGGKREGQKFEIQIFHTKNTPVHWGDLDPIKQEYSLVQRKKFIG